MHPGYASSLNNIGRTYDYKGDYDQALDYYFKSLEIRKIALG
jgi:tetratricopeptide (TPR) repeat protein